MQQNQKARTTVVVERRFRGKRSMCDVLISRLLEKNNAPFFAYGVDRLYNEDDKIPSKACCPSKEV